MASYDPTIADSHRKQVTVDGDVCLLNVLDAASSEYDMGLCTAWIYQCRAFALVYSICDRSSFDRLNGYAQTIFRIKDRTDIPILLVGNKCDEEMQRQVPLQEAQELADALGCSVMETSAKDNINLELLFFTLIRNIRTDRKHLENRSHHVTTSVNRLSK